MLGATILVFGIMPTTDVTKGPSDNCPPANRPTENRTPLVPPDEEHLVFSLDQLKFFLNHATAVQINGSIVALVKDMLVVNTTEDHITVLHPENWTVDNMVVSRETLFNGTSSEVGQNVTVKALKSIVFEHDNFSINIIVSYEVINAKGIHIRTASIQHRNQALNLFFFECTEYLIC